MLHTQMQKVNLLLRLPQPVFTFRRLANALAQHRLNGGHYDR